MGGIAQLTMMQDYAVGAKQWGADIKLKPHADEKLATNDFKSGKCDGAAITRIRARLLLSLSLWNFIKACALKASYADSLLP